MSQIGSTGPDDMLGYLDNSEYGQSKNATVMGPSFRKACGNHFRLNLTGQAQLMGEEKVFENQHSSFCPLSHPQTLPSNQNPPCETGRGGAGTRCHYSRYSRPRGFTHHFWREGYPSMHFAQSSYRSCDQAAQSESCLWGLANMKL